jgi:hypothetical protein
MTMTIRRHGRPDAEKAERLLGSGFGGVAVDGDPLAVLLAAAAAPARPGELAGEDAALAAFCAARVAPGHSAPARARRRWRRTAGTAWIAVAAATATAGVAVAASTQSRDGAAPPRRSAVPAPEQRGTPAGTGPGTGAPHPTSPPPGAAGPASTAATPPTAFSQATGLCRAYLAKDGMERGKSLQTPAFRALVTAAGGVDKVDAFCRQVVPTPSERPKPSADHGRASAPEPSAKSAGKSSD